MRALVYHGSGLKSRDEIPDPQLRDDLDAVIGGIEAVTICGTDLHILPGDVCEVAPGRVLGHEAVGIVEAVGRGVRSIVPGDRVLISCITGCGLCRPCRKARMEAYDVFERAGETGALKVVLTRAVS